MALATIVTFWDGPITFMERTSVASMRAHGHNVIVYSYAPETIERQSIDAVVEDARSVLPLTPELQRIAKAKPAFAADIFRLELMRQSRGVWMDLDIVLVAPLEAPSADLYGFEEVRSHVVNNAVLYLAPASPLLHSLIEFVHRRPVMAPWWRGKRLWKHRLALLARVPIAPENCQWGVFGPKALTWFVDELRLRHVVQPAEVFYPVSWNKRGELIDGTRVEEQFLPSTVCVHLWANGLRNMIAGRGLDPGSYLARTARRLGVTIPAAERPA